MLRRECLDSKPTNILVRRKCQSQYTVESNLRLTYRLDLMEVTISENPGFSAKLEMAFTLLCPLFNV